MTLEKGRVFSGARPTGRQHLGNYLGAIKNYVALQDEYECVYCIVDLHALTTVETTDDLRQNTYEMALDWLAPASARRIDHVRPVASAAGDRAAHHPLDGHPAGQADRPADLQREGPPAAQQRQLRPGGLPGADDRRYRALQEPTWCRWASTRRRTSSSPARRCARSTTATTPMC